jgi:putative ABC transport system permease protein
VAVVEIDLPADAYDTRRKGIFLGQVADRLRTPEGPPIGLANWEPLGGSAGFAPVRHPGQSDEQAVVVQTIGVSAEYFQVLRIPIVAGRTFSADETSARPARPVLVNERFASVMWQGQPAIGAIGKRFFSRYKDPIEHEVIGVVKDVYTESVDRIEPMFYNVFGGALEPKLLARTSDAQALARVSSVAAELDSRARVLVKPLSDNFREEIAMSRRTALMAGGLGSLALALSTVGMFGVFAYVVQQRTREIGIRMALGAHATDVVRLVLAGNARPVIAGFAVGVMGAMGSARLLQHLLLGLSPFDPIAHLGVAAVLAAAGVAASYVPVRRAMRVDPIVALRHD